MQEVARSAPVGVSAGTNGALWRRWLARITFYAVVGASLASALCYPTLYITLVLSGGLAWSGVGLAQGRVLQDELPNRNLDKLGPLSVLGANLGWLVLVLLLMGQMFYTSFAISGWAAQAIFTTLLLCMAGSFFGLSQWLALRKLAGRYFWWVGATAAATAVGGLIGLGLSRLVYDNLIPWNWKGAYMPFVAEAWWLIGAYSLSAFCFALLMIPAATRLVRQLRADEPKP